MRIKVDLKVSGRAVAMVTPMTSTHCAMCTFRFDSVHNTVKTLRSYSNML